jgi:hypothetical protein
LFGLRRLLHLTCLLPYLQQPNVQSCTIRPDRKSRLEKKRSNQVLIFQALRSALQEKRRKCEAGMIVALLSSRLFWFRVLLTRSDASDVPPERDVRVRGRNAMEALGDANTAR